MKKESSKENLWNYSSLHVELSFLCYCAFMSLTFDIGTWLNGIKENYILKIFKLVVILEIKK
jgi:hypothetical protein